jgi:hypothetical protein
LEAAKQGANPAITPWVAGAILDDRIEKQKRMGMGQGAAQGEQETVSDQQDEELQGIMQAMAPQDAGQAQAAPQEAPVMAAGGGLMQARVNPGIYDYCGGGIIAFSGEERSDVPAAEDDAVYDPVSGALISGGETRRGETPTIRESLGLGNEANRRALEQLEEDQRKANAPKPRPASNLSAGEKDKQSEYARLIKAGVPPEVAAQLAGMSPAAKPAAAAKPPAAGGGGAKAPAGPAKDTGLMSLLTSSPEWADLDAARKKQFEAPKIGQTAGELAAEKAAHLKAQGITEMPWETVDKQTKALIEQLGQEDFARAAKREADKGRPAYSRMVANMGAGSFGQAGSAGVRANIKYQDEMDAEDQRIKELRYNQKLKLNELNAKAQELRYNEATGDVAAAQKNRKDIAEMQREFEKNKMVIAKGQADLRERGLAAQLQSDTQLKAAGMRQGASGTLTPKQLADIRDKANDNIKDRLKAAGIPLQMAMKKDPAMYARMVEEETNRLLGQTQGGTMPPGGGAKLSSADQALINKYAPKK